MAGRAAGDPVFPEGDEGEIRRNRQNKKDSLTPFFFLFSKKVSEKNLATLNGKGMNITILITESWINFQSCPSDNFHALRSSASLLLIRITLTAASPPYHLTFSPSCWPSILNDHLIL